MQWSELSPDEKYGVVKLAENGVTPVTELCATFGVSRQVLHEAREKAQAAAVAALAPRPPGRKPRSPEAEAVAALKAEQAKAQAEVAHWKQRYQAAMAFLELERKLARGESLPGETPEAKKKASRRERRAAERARTKTERRATTAAGVPPPGPAGTVVGGDDGPGDGPDPGDPAPLADPPAGGPG